MRIGFAMWCESLRRAVTVVNTFVLVSAAAAQGDARVADNGEESSLMCRLIR